MGAVADVEPQPLGEREVTKCGVSHEQVRPPGRQQLAGEREEPRHTVAQLTLHRARIGMLGRLGYLRSTPPRRNPPHIEIQEMRQPLPHFLYLDMGWIPSGRRAPEETEPAEHPDARAVERQLRDGVTRFLALARELLPARRADLFVRHPAFGDLTLPEWLRFHVRHCAHHARQIRARLAS